MNQNDNTTPYESDLYDEHVVETIPYYLAFHQETINLIKCQSFEPELWFDAGCGTGSLVKSAIKKFPNTRFLLLDPSQAMLEQAQEKLSVHKNRFEILNPAPTQDFSQKLEEKPDVITAVQCHHYLSKDERIKAVQVCHDLLRNKGIFVTFENIRPLTDKGIEIGLNYWRNFQLNNGKDPEEVESHLQRFDAEYFPITVEDHLELLRETGFETVELFWYSYLQAGFYCIK